MGPQKFDIPAAYQSQLVFNERRDARSDGEILDGLSNFRHVTSEKNIWAFWHSGIRSMPAWCQRNVCAWVRMHSDRGWTVRVLDSIQDSANYALKYVPEDGLPDSFVHGTMDGPYVGPHSADILRGACLYAHGGVFLDVGIILIRNLDDVCWAKLEDPTTPYELAAPWVYGTHIANHFVVARKGNPFIHRWHELFCHLWEGHTNFTGLMKSPLMKIVADQKLDLERAQKFQWEISIDPSIVDEYVAQVQCWNRVCLLEDAGDGFSGVDYWTKKILLWEPLQENWGAESTLGFKGCGQKMYDLFSLPLDTDAASGEYQSAELLVWRLLSGSSMQKIFRGKGMTKTTELGELWDEDQEDRDCKKGTFAELLRYGCENFKQTRPEIAYVEAPRPEQTYKKRLLEV